MAPRLRQPWQAGIRGSGGVPYDSANGNLCGAMQGIRKVPKDQRGLEMQLMTLQKEDIGGGTGGSAGGFTKTLDHSESHDGLYKIAANQIELLSRPPLPPASPSPNAITLMATDLTGMQGTVDLRGAQGVRVTAGPPMLPPAASDSTNGVEIIVGETQNVTIQRGLLPGVDQKIEMAPGSITIDAGAGTLTIQSLTQITLSVAGGLSTITLGPEGITIQGVLVQIN
jgi:hypothetical protein